MSELDVGVGILAATVISLGLIGASVQAYRIFARLTQGHRVLARLAQDVAGARVDEGALVVVRHGIEVRVVIESADVAIASCDVVGGTLTPIVEVEPPSRVLARWVCRDAALASLVDAAEAAKDRLACSGQRVTVRGSASAPGIVRLAELAAAVAALPRDDLALAARALGLEVRDDTVVASVAGREARVTFVRGIVVSCAGTAPGVANLESASLVRSQRGERLETLTTRLFGATVLVAEGSVAVRLEPGASPADVEAAIELLADIVSPASPAAGYR